MSLVKKKNSRKGNRKYTCLINVNITIKLGKEHVKLIMINKKSTCGASHTLINITCYLCLWYNIQI